MAFGQLVANRHLFGEFGDMGDDPDHLARGAQLGDDSRHHLEGVAVKSAKALVQEDGVDLGPTDAGLSHLVGQRSVQVTIELSRAVGAPGTDRELGAAFGVFAIH